MPGLREEIIRQHEAAQNMCAGSLEQAKRKIMGLEAQLTERAKLLEGLQPDQKAALLSFIRRVTVRQ